ncbi:hypothetical protein JCM5350_002956 [Sporobolomyces pararoseus]
MPGTTVWTESTVDPITLRYHDKLPLLFSPLPPPFSSSASHSLASRQTRGLHQTELSTKCTRCRAEVIGGINGAYWVERGELWLNCQGCGWATKRLRESKSQEENGKGKGKEVFESVKKRRKERERREKEANSHPTQFRSTPLLASTADKARMTKQKSVNKPTASPSSTTPSIQSTSNSKSNSPRPPPLDSSLPSSLPSVNATETKGPSSTHSPSASDSRTPSASPAPTSLDSKLAASKKRKRSKQPIGLAGLLAKKKKDEEGSSGCGGGGGGGGLGLQDFLKGL